jgi:hypothetical protein
MHVCANPHSPFRTHQRSRPPSRAYAEILIQSAANCQDGRILASYIRAT